MKAGWQTKPFEDCIKKVTYTTKIQRKDFLPEGTHPIVSQEEDFINGYWNNEADLFKVETPVTIFGDHTKILKYITFDFVLGADGVKILPPLHFLEPKFFFYQLQTANLESLGYARHYKLLKELKIVYPSRVEQQRIAAILDQAFEGIAKARANAEQNLQNARALFESHLQSVFTERSKGWTTKSVGELVTDGVLYKPFDGNHGEIHPRKSDFIASGVPFVMASDLVNGEVDTENCNHISKELADSLRVGFAKNGDVLISHKGTIGRSALVTTSLEYIMLTPQVTAYRIKDRTRFLNKFIRYYFMSPIFQNEIISAAQDGSTRAYIGITRQSNLRFIFPSVNEQQSIVDTSDQLLPETQRLEALYQRKIGLLDELKKSLLQQAFAGEL